MRAVVQRVTSASVAVDGEVKGRIDCGLLVLVAVMEGDTGDDLSYIGDKIIGLRIFTDEQGKMNLSVSDVGGGVLLVSQFTLAGDARKGKRPSFSDSAAPDIAEKMYLELRDYIISRGIPCPTGVFAAHMDVSLTNNGPVTILLDSRRTF